MLRRSDPNRLGMARPGEGGSLAELVRQQSEQILKLLECPPMRLISHSSDVIRGMCADPSSAAQQLTNSDLSQEKIFRDQMTFEMQNVQADQSLITSVILSNLKLC